MSPDPCRSIHMYLKFLCQIHVSGSMSRHPYLWILSAICISAFVPMDPAQNRRSAHFLWPSAGKALRPRSPLVFRKGETYMLTCRNVFLWPCAGERQIGPPETRLASISCGVTRNRDQMNENRHGATARRQNIFRPGETQILTSGAVKTEGGQYLHLDPRSFLYPYRKNPSVCHTVLGKNQNVRP